jgi:hypothetical protein
VGPAVLAETVVVAVPVALLARRARTVTVAMAVTPDTVASVVMVPTTTVASR